MGKYIIYQENGDITWYLSSPSVQWEANPAKACHLSQIELLEVLDRLTTMQRISRDPLVFSVCCIEKGSRV